MIVRGIGCETAQQEQFGCTKLKSRDDKADQIGNASHESSRQAESDTTSTSSAQVADSIFAPAFLEDIFKYQWYCKSYF